MCEMSERTRKMAGIVLDGGSLTRQQGLDLARTDGQEMYDLFYWANRIRLHFVGPAVHGCGIVAGKVGACAEDCRFCSQSAHHKTHIDRPTILDPDAIVEAARRSAGDGVSCFGLVNSGLGPTDEEIERFAESLRQVCREGWMDVCASLGVLTEAQAQRLYDLGVRKYNHNLQTSRRFWPSTCTTHTYDQRIETVRLCKQMGMDACCGGLFGMGETWEDRVDLALQLRDLKVDVVPLNFLIPIPGTPLAGCASLATFDCLKIVSLYRFLLPGQRIKVSGGREIHLRDLQSWMFFAGANGFLIGNYLTTCGRSVQQDLQMLQDLQLPLAGAASVEPGPPLGASGPVDNTRAVHDQVARHIPASNP
jgi:biotin synthase